MTERDHNIPDAFFDRFDSNTFTGKLSTSKPLMSNPLVFDVFVDGRPVIGTIMEIRSLLHEQDSWSFVLHMPERIDTARTRSIVVKYHDTDKLVDIGSDLAAFI